MLPFSAVSAVIIANVYKWPSIS